MILNLTKTEISILLLNMAMCRKNIRNGFKSNYGRDKATELLSSFDEVKNSMEEIASEFDEDEDMEGMAIIHHNINEIEMIRGFINWYVPKTEETIKKAFKGHIRDEDKQQLDCLRNIKHKADKLVSA